jgi:hypothetical protein
VRLLHEAPEPFLALAEPLLRLNPREEVSEEVADDLKQRDVLV